MGRNLKEKLRDLPQIDATIDFPPAGSAENIDYANRLLNNCLRFYTLDQIAAHTGICRRLLSYMRHRGLNSYANQLALEILAGAKLLIEK